MKAAAPILHPPRSGRALQPLRRYYIRLPGPRLTVGGQLCLREHMLRIANLHLVAFDRSCPCRELAVGKHVITGDFSVTLSFVLNRCAMRSNLRSQNTNVE